MGSKHLTETACKAASAEAVASGKRRDVPDRVQRGLILRVTPTGAASFAFAYRMPGQTSTQRITLGPFPAVKLGEARERSGELAKLVARGTDPKAEERRKREADAAVEAEWAERKTVEQAVDDYLTIKLRKDRTRAGARSTFYKDVIPAVGPKALTEFTKKDMQKIIAGVEARGSMTQAGLVLQYTRAMMNWHIERGTIDSHDLQSLKVSHTSEPRDRTLSVMEVRAFWRLLPDVRMYEQERDILRLQLLLACRVGEVAGMLRHEIDFERRIFTIPAVRSKNGKAHEVPLGPMAQEIIHRAMQAHGGKLLFPRHDGARLTPNAIATSLLRGQSVFDFKLPSDEPNSFTSHDLRRTCATLMEKGGTARSVVSLVLNHRDGNATVTDRHYIHADTLRQKRLALLTWEKNLRAILAGVDPFENTLDDPDELERQIMADAKPRPEQSVVVPMRSFR